MDTYINIKIDSIKDEDDIDKLFDEIDYLYDTYHKLTDRYNEYDNVINVYYLNEKLGNNKEIVIDKRLEEIISIGLDYYDKTDGLFNIASGNLTGIWKEFIDICDEVPSIEILSGNIDKNDIVLSDSTYLKQNDVKLDLGAIVKGYVTELTGNFLEANGVYSYIINAGGNVKVGKSYDKEAYVVGITNPDSTNDIFTKVYINNLSVVTSGSYQRYCSLDDKVYSHIINPITKYPSSYVKSVTVISEDSMIADIYSTYLYLLPIEEGLKIVNGTSDIEAIWYVDSDNIIRSDGFSYE